MGVDLQTKIEQKYAPLGPVGPMGIGVRGRVLVAGGTEGQGAGMRHRDQGDAGGAVAGEGNGARKDNTLTIKLSPEDMDLVRLLKDRTGMTQLNMLRRMLQFVLHHQAWWSLI